MNYFFYLSTFFTSIKNFNAIYLFQNDINNTKWVDICILHNGQKLKIHTLFPVSYIIKDKLVHPYDRNKKIEWEDLIVSSPTNNFNFRFHGVE